MKDQSGAKLFETGGKIKGRTPPVAPQPAPGTPEEERDEDPYDRDEGQEVEDPEEFGSGTAPTDAQESNKLNMASKEADATAKKRMTGFISSIRGKSAGKKDSK